MPPSRPAVRKRPAMAAPSRRAVAPEAAAASAPPPTPPAFGAQEGRAMPPSRAAARAPQPQPQATSFNYSHRSKFFCTYCGKKWKVCHTIRPTYCWRCRIPGCAAVSRKVASAAEDFNAPLIQTADTVAEDAKKDDAKVVSGPPAPDAADRAALWAMAKAVAQSPAAAAATGAHVPAEVLETFLFQRADTEPSEGSQAAGAEWPREEIRDFLTDPSRYNFTEPKPDPPGPELAVLVEFSPRQFYWDTASWDTDSDAAAVQPSQEGEVVEPQADIAPKADEADATNVDGKIKDDGEKTPGATAEALGGIAAAEALDGTAEALSGIAETPGGSAQAPAGGAAKSEEEPPQNFEKGMQVMVTFGRHKESYDQKVAIIDIVLSQCCWVFFAEGPAKVETSLVRRLPLS